MTTSAKRGSKPSEPALPAVGSLNGSRLVYLHEAIRDLLPELRTGELDKPREEAWQHAFSGNGISHRLFKYWYFRASVLKRYQHGTISADQREAETLWQYGLAEERCRETNRRLYGALHNSALIPPHTVALLKRARKVILNVLGEVQYDEVFRGFAFSTGATTEMRRRDAAIAHKWEKGSHIHVGGVALYNAFLNWCEGSRFLRGLDKLVRQDEGHFFSVLKNYKADRGCETQPTITMALQKAVAGCMKNRARRVGLLKTDAQQYHAELAREGSRTGRLTTADLENASNSLALALPLALLEGTRWWRLLLATRVERVRMPGGHSIVLEKISSMGNGWTFELQTLIYYSILKAVCGEESEVSVFGDDLIYPTKHHQAVVEAFTALGFRFNHEKTFASGSFRESCGGHYRDGRCVKPIYIEQLPSTIGQVIQLHNDLIWWLRDMPPLGGFMRVLEECRKLVPRALRGPYGVPGVLWSNSEDATPKYRYRHAWESVRVWATDLETREQFVVTRRKVAGPAYHRWVVKGVRFLVPEQRHDYYVGALGATLWAGMSIPDEDPKPPSNRRKTLDRYYRPVEERSHADFKYAEAKVEVVMTVPVDVPHRWPRLPVTVLTN